MKKRIHKYQEIDTKDWFDKNSKKAIERRGKKSKDAEKSKPFTSFHPSFFSNSPLQIPS